MSDEKPNPGDALTEEFEKSFSENDEAVDAASEEEAPLEINPEEPQTLEVVKLTQEIKAEKDKYFRVLAELENTRKRMQKEKTDMTKFAVENVIAEFLGPLDSYEKALSFASEGSDEVKNWATGFEMILTQFRDILSSQGVSPFDSMGKTFDPHAHEAVEMVEVEKGPENVVIEECIKGYRSGDRIIRPAKVKVSKLKKESDNGREEEK
ncbi:MAG: Protein GrpE [Chlamydiia bacterium]|nr:Protein GrpE [Chlamydiia bacterium]MCH9616128.1 Protein GrpE [Chlamydiia bacterium]MCH9629449.1 Protein GrpE [Chlamydiia bacterium]